MSKAEWRSWNPKAVREAVIADLLENGEIAGKFIETDARRRLLAIKDPEWGAKYRRLIVGRLLTSFAVKEANRVTIWIGVALGPKGSHHGFWIEVGSRTSPAQPFLRPAVFQNAREIVQLLAGR